MEHQHEFTDKGNQQNNGNGSLMRLAPIPIAFRSNKEEAMKYSGLQSLTTHNGLEAAECSRLLAGLIVTLINRRSEEWR
jgi:ADP-ribosyl-[dinitrogen reductase] hydrolase